MGAPERLSEAVGQAAVERNGRMTLGCADAFKLAEATDVELNDVYRVCNQEDIKIVQCQLGCFP